MDLSRRLLLGLLIGTLLAGCAGLPQGESRPPIVFAHGNGHTAALLT